MRCRFPLIVLLVVCSVSLSAQRAPTPSDVAGIAKALVSRCANDQALVKDATSPSGVKCVTVASGGGGAPTTATYVTKTPDAGLSAEQALSALSTGLMNSTTTTGVVSTLAPTDDNLVVGSGSVWQLKALTTCTGAGKAVTYDASANTFGCNTISGAPSLPGNTKVLFDNNGSIGGFGSWDGTSIGEVRFRSGSSVFLTQLPNTGTGGYFATDPLYTNSQFLQTFTTPQAGPTAGFGDLNIGSLGYAGVNLSVTDPDYNFYFGAAGIAALAAGHDPYGVIGVLGQASYGPVSPDGTMAYLIGTWSSASNTSAMNSADAIGTYSEAQIGASTNRAMGQQSLAITYNASTVASLYGQFLDVGVLDTSTVGNVYQSYAHAFKTSANVTNWYGYYVTSLAGLGSGVLHPFHYEGATDHKAWIDSAGDLTLETAKGTGTQFACFDSTGKLVRSATACGS